MDFFSPEKGGTEVDDVQIKALQDMMILELKKFMRPEFINRIDDIVIFKPLGHDVLRSIITLELQKVSDLLAEKDITVTWDDSVYTYLIKYGIDTQFGARPLKRAITRTIVNPLSMKLLNGDIAE